MTPKLQALLDACDKLRSYAAPVIASPKRLNQIDAERRQAQHQVIRHAMALTAQDVPRWIPVTERLPADGKWVPITIAVTPQPDGHWFKWKFKDGQWLDSSGMPVLKNPTHWLELPALPEKV